MGTCNCIERECKYTAGNDLESTYEAQLGCKRMEQQKSVEREDLNGKSSREVISNIRSLNLVSSRLDGTVQK